MVANASLVLALVSNNLLVFFLGLALSKIIHKEDIVLSVEENKAVIRRIYEEVLNKGNLGVIDRLCSPKVVDYYDEKMVCAGPSGSCGAG